jgi:predicted permease
MTHFVGDVRLAIRSWRKAPGFVAIALLSIALGVGATTSIFTLVDQVLLRTLPVADPDELVQVTFSGSRYGNNWGDGSELSYPMFSEIRDNNTVFAGVFARFAAAMHVGHGGRTERATGELVSGSYFETLRVGAAIGRVLGPDDDRQREGHPVAVLGYGFWQTAFGADPNVVNSSIVINGHSYTVVGVARQGFEGIELGRTTQVFAPLMMKSRIAPALPGWDDRLFRWVRVFARLRPGVSREQARATVEPYFRSLLALDLDSPGFANAAARMRDRYRENALAILDASQGRSGLRRALTTPLWVLMGTAAAVLLIACANIANLLLARGAARQREIAIRLALGAGRRRIVGQLLVESLMLALLGGVIGLGISFVGAPAVLGLFASSDAPRPISTSPDWRIVAFTFSVATMTGVLFGLAPALKSARPNVAPTLKEQAGSVVGGRARLRKGLVAVQIMLSFLLVTGAALFIRTLDNLLALDIGFDASRILSFGIDPTLSGYDTERTRQFVRTLLERLDRTPGVEGAGLATVRLLEGNQWNSLITVEGYQPKPDENTGVWNNSISPGYFKAMGIPLLMGRDFDERDARTGPLPPGARDLRVAIVNEQFVKQFFGTANPIGRHIGFGADPNTPTPMEIIGVVRDSKYTNVRDEVQKQAFFPYFEAARPGGFTMYVRTTQPPAAMFATLRQVVQQLDPNIPVFSTRTVERQVAQSVSRERMVAAMTVTFGSLATMLAVVGLYGVMSYTVARRIREIGVRVAFGARAQDIGWLIIREVLAIGVAGIVLGVPLAWWLGRFVSSQLYGVKPGDPLTFAAAGTLLIVVTVAAGLVPSVRASRIDPTRALRQE